jgi:hypothetical protein
MGQIRASEEANRWHLKFSEAGCSRV